MTTYYDLSGTIFGGAITIGAADEIVDFHGSGISLDLFGTAISIVVGAVVVPTGIWAGNVFVVAAGMVSASVGVVSGEGYPCSRRLPASEPVTFT